MPVPCWLKLLTRDLSSCALSTRPTGPWWLWTASSEIIGNCWVSSTSGGKRKSQFVGCLNTDLRAELWYFLYIYFLLPDFVCLSIMFSIMYWTICFLPFSSSSTLFFFFFFWSVELQTAFYLSVKVSWLSSIARINLLAKQPTILLQFVSNLNSTFLYYALELSLLQNKMESWKLYL